MRSRALPVGLLLLAAYALPLFAPPATSETVIDGWWLERLFPDVPMQWTGIRLLCLLVGALLVGSHLPPIRFVADGAKPTPAEPTSPALQTGALALACACAAAALAAESMSRSLQLCFIAGIWSPALLVATAGSSLRRDPNRFPPPGAVAVSLLWAAWRLFTGLGSSRAADAVDTIMSLDEVARVSDPAINLLTEGAHTGVSSLHLSFHGTPLFTWYPSALSLPALQILNAAWFAVAALLLATLLARCGRRSYAPAAAAALLFSPFAMLAPLVAAPLYLGSLLTAAQLFLLWQIRSQRSATALLLIAPVTGIGISHPATAPTSMAILAAAALVLWRLSLPPRLIAAAALVLFATVFPGLPSLDTLASMNESFSSGNIAWRELEPILLGQTSPDGVGGALQNGRPGPLDAAVGSLLSPFATPRTALRLWGDTLYEPLSAALAACALVLCARRRSLRGLLLPGLLITALASGFVSSYDRPSLTRTLCAPVAVALLAGYGLMALCENLDRRRRNLALALTTVAVMTSGGTLFDAVNPAILSRSSHGLAFAALRQASGRPITLLTHAKYDWLRAVPIASEVPALPSAVFEIRSTGSVEHLLARPVDLVAWSPALDRDFSLRRELCRLRPDAVVFDVVDRAGRSRVLIAALRGPGWTPALPQEQWSTTRCGDSA